MNTAVSHPEARAAAPRPSARRRWLFGLFVAALLVVGLFQTLIIFADDEPTPPLRMAGTHLVASGMLSYALHQPDAASLERAPAVGPRSRDADGRECRRFAGRADVEGTIAGTACLIEGEWRVVDLRQDVAPPKLR